MYRTQCFTAFGSTKLEIKFNPFKGKDGKPLPNGNGQFVVSDHSNPDKNLEGTIKQYVDAKPSKQAVDAIENYKTMLNVQRLA